VSLDLTDRIDRLEALEDKAELLLSAMSAINRNNYGFELVVSGEVVFQRPPKREYEAQVHVAVYNSKGQVVEKESQHIGQPGSPYDAFKIVISGNHAEASKIRVYVSREPDE
jgi:hypothetical protein